MKRKHEWPLTRKEVRDIVEDDAVYNNDWATQKCISPAKLTRRLNQLLRQKGKHHVGPS
jgi:hypothetical protein